MKTSQATRTPTPPQAILVRKSRMVRRSGIWLSGFASRSAASAWSRSFFARRCAERDCLGMSSKSGSGCGAIVLPISARSGSFPSSSMTKSSSAAKPEITFFTSSSCTALVGRAMGSASDSTSIDAAFGIGTAASGTTSATSGAAAGVGSSGALGASPLLGGSGVARSTAILRAGAATRKPPATARSAASKNKRIVASGSALGSGVARGREG
mmetsp:Transcript_18377/g.56129  ORF Transcript_18377/g.56129 Transcript_18377/m.56129 type:complete len:212 (+) Transcript_18377:186-821(+)